MAFLLDYGLFLAKTVTLLAALLFAAAALINLGARGRQRRERLEVRKLNRRYRDMEHSLRRQMTDARGLKRLERQYKRQHKQATGGDADKSRVFVLNFHGDIRASRVESLREEISAILSVAGAQDQVLLRLESPGGVVHGYGLAASQLVRLRERGIPLTVSVDKVAASGGYLMAAVADRVLAAPFAVVGSIGVVAQLPNFHRLLKKHDVDFEMLTAGEYKRTLTVFGENTEQGREKFREDLEAIHRQFKDFITRYRPQLDLARVATGEHWLGEQAKALGLVDELGTSDDYLLRHAADHQLIELRFHPKRSLSKRMGQAAENTLERWLSKPQIP
ncbi:protease SohB [Alkalilimnicola sp. S0819]|uniref:protease SohB n=1 Tax=Alkalilimnicola sp. S0819 TaxID=2613922 RepID=UPI001261A139|nr:protease SohB [Alkalilimnicola sp. S0819]KAB7624446.1 protease SohB [Alkalilimnicola sp. S0819]MPQ16280.1 protease SohB [Alkalilimnicola sp. S0819]